MRSLTYARGNPYLLMIKLSMAGSAILFFFLVLVFFQRISLDPSRRLAMPPAFIFSTICMLLSSVSLFLANRFLNSERYRLGFQYLLITLLLGLAFMLLQVAGGLQLLRSGVPLYQTHPAFILLFSGLHFLHIILGVMGLSVVTYHSWQNRNYVDGFIQAQNPVKRTWLHMVTWFWHFLDILWIILFVLLWAFGAA